MAQEGFVVFDTDKGVLQAFASLEEAKDAAKHYAVRDGEPGYGIDVSRFHGKSAQATARSELRVAANPPPLRLNGLRPLGINEVFPYGNEDFGSEEGEEDRQARKQVETYGRSLVAAYQKLAPYFP